MDSPRRLVFCVADATPPVHDVGTEGLCLLCNLIHIKSPAIISLWLGGAGNFGYILAT